MLQEVKENGTKLLPERSHVSQEQGPFPILAGLIVGNSTTPGRCGPWYKQVWWGSGFSCASWKGSLGCPWHSLEVSLHLDRDSGNLAGGGACRIHSVGQVC